MAEEKLKEYFEGNTIWKEELQKLREIVISTDLVETVKWGMPAYTYNGKNVVGIAAFKENYSLWFFQGSLLKDEKKLLVNAQKGKTKAMRHMKFSKTEKPKKTIIKSYIKESILNFEKGLTIRSTKKSTDYNLPTQLSELFEKDKAAHRCFSELTAAQQRDYANYISEAKREATKKSRLEKIVPLILEGKPINALWTC